MGPHSVHRAGWQQWQAKMDSIEVWRPWHNVHSPNFEVYINWPLTLSPWHALTFTLSWWHVLTFDPIMMICTDLWPYHDDMHWPLTLSWCVLSGHHIWKDSRERAIVTPMAGYNNYDSQNHLRSVKYMYMNVNLVWCLFSTCMYVLLTYSWTSCLQASVRKHASTPTHTYTHTHVHTYTQCYCFFSQLWVWRLQSWASDEMTKKTKTQYFTRTQTY